MIPRASAAASETTPSRKEPSFRVEVVTSPCELLARRTEWDALAAQALVANPFYESWMLLPALDAFASPGSVEILLIIRDDPNGRPLLVGLLPCERFKRFHGMPCRGMSLWNHLHGVLSTPLLHRDHAAQAIGALLDHVRSAGLGLLTLELVDAERSFSHALIDVLNRRRLFSIVEDQHNRAFLRPRGNADDYLSQAIGGKHRQEYRRQRRRLGDHGALESRILQPDEAVDPWLDAFFRLEASGWKGEEATALAARPKEQEFFRTIVRTAHAAGRLHMLGLFLSGEAIAVKCNFLSGGGAFSLKIAYDERYAKYSPGVLLELDTIEDIHSRREVGWMDSCACANHPMIDRLWLDRRSLQRRVIATGSRWANCVLGLTALLRAMKRSLRR